MKKDFDRAALELTEEIGARITDLDAAIERIHYSPEGIDELDVYLLKDILTAIDNATERAEAIERRLHR